MPLRIFLITVLAMPYLSALAADKSGEQIYLTQCARCHGKSGEGVAKHYPYPLVGEKSIQQLAKYVAQTMPEDDPGTCTGVDADRVSEYMYNAFYSPAAQARNKPAKIEVSRLTNKQFRNALTDLVASFRPAPKWDDQRGLKAEYFNARNFRNDKRVLERIDPKVDFDWKAESPEPGKIEAVEFSARWNGSIYPPETGMYEFIVRTDHAVRLWVNDNNDPLIDAWVKSGKDNEFRGSILLQSGRAYPLRLEFSKGKQGVDDSKKNPNKKVAPTMMHLEWIPPESVRQVIEPRYLLPTRTPEVFITQAQFPPDDRSLGWERGSAVSKAWDSATTDAAIELATFFASKADEFAGTKTGAPDRMNKLKVLCQRIGDRAFRRPMSDELKKLYIEKQFADTKDPILSVKKSVLLILKSPRFLYRDVETRTDSFEIASRLSFGLWDSIPDQTLWDAANSGKLKSPAEVRKQAERMMNDPRSRMKLRSFLIQWAKADQAADLTKDPKKYPGFTDQIIADLRTSMTLGLEEVIDSPEADFRRFFNEESLWMNGRLSQYYGGKLSADAPFQKVKLDSGGARAGLVTHPYLLARFAYTSSTSPIHRGVFVGRGLLGVMLRPPQDAFTPLSEDLHPQLTTRERVELQTKPANCQSCHQVINPLGFTLENYDAVGRFRQQDNQKPINALGGYVNRAGEKVTFNGAKDLAKFIASSSDAHTALVDQLFHHLVQQPIRAYGLDARDKYRDFFAQNGFNLRKLMIEMVVTSSAKGRDVQSSAMK